MKTEKDLFSRICSYENLVEAERKARRCKSRRYGVVLFDKNRDHLLSKLQQKLQNGTYKTSDYTIYELMTDAGKMRTIYRLPYYPDRICHHAVMNVLEPIWKNIFTRDTYACIKGRGIHAAVCRLKNELKDRDNTKFCLKLDIKKFYPSINHDILKAIIRKKIADNDLLQILDEIIDSADGVPIGNYLSQYFANLYLAYFDHWIKEEMKVKYYYRYADDMVIMHADKAYLHSLFKEIKSYLNKELDLTVKGNWQVFPVDARGIDFLGYVFFHSHTLLRKRIKKQFAKRRHNMVSAISYLGWCKHCDAKNLIRKLGYEGILK